MKSKRLVDGILLLDKPIGISSNAALQRCKRLYHAAKAGHTGSLDPLATGMLPICFGQATKFCQYLLEADKSYLVQGKLGCTTTTGDAEGEVLDNKPVEVSLQQLEAVVAKFRGVISQVPPMYSALKHQGKPLYVYAREGITIERKAREVCIYDCDLLAFENDCFTLRVSCSKGTYIRSLVEDIGTALACGSHVIELRRLTVADFKQQSLITLPQLEATEDFAVLDKFLLPIESALSHYPQVELSENAIRSLRQGRVIKTTEALTQHQLYRAYSSERYFVGLVESRPEQQLAVAKLLV